MRKRILSLLIISAMIAVFIPVINAEDKTDNEKVTLIVEVRGDAALETDKAILMGAAEYNETDEAAQQTEKILSVQESVQQDIKSKVNKKAEFGFTYTNVLNGFSVTVNKSDIDKIKALPNVENVYISQKNKYIEPIEEGNNREIELFSEEYDTNTENAPVLEGCCASMNVPYLHERGYQGQGQVIVVMDSELDVDHEFFASSVENPHYSKTDIENLIAEKSLNANVTADEAYHSEKIPFTYDYAKKTADVRPCDADTVHGTHTSGIATGKNGTNHYGAKFSSTAPEAQLIFMKVFDMYDGIECLPDDVLIAAVDDASKMDIAAINMSLGSDSSADALIKVITNAVDAGIHISVSANNMGRDDFIDPSDIDYSTSPMLPSISAAMSVGSSEASLDWEKNENGEYELKPVENYEKINDFSAWGTNNTLELKPEITTPGFFIYSSKPNNKYDYRAGTSMSSPHMAGSAVLMRQYIDANYQGKFENPARFIEQLTMSSAPIIWENESEKIPYSPRFQGAGLLDLEAAAKTPVVLIGTEDKSKISLKDKLTDTFQIEFTARNFSESDVKYDTVDFSLITDGYKYSTSYKRNYIDGAKKLSYTSSDMPESVTVPANGETKISFTVEIDSTETAENMQVFTNGFFLDGFVELSDSNNTIPAISIPYTGFYGDWTAQPAFDKPYYEGGGKYTYLGSHHDSCVCFWGRVCPRLGRNQFSSKASGMEYEAEEYAGISPNNDNSFDFLCVVISPIRAMSGCSVRVENESGEIVKIYENSNIKLSRLIANHVDLEMDNLPDGDYTAYVTSHFDYEGAGDEEISMKFYIDTVAPEVISHEILKDKDAEGNDKTYLGLEVTDNRYVMGGYVDGKNSDGTDFHYGWYSKANKTITGKIDITGVDTSTLKITAIDYAYNQYECNVLDLQSPTPSPTPTPTSTPSETPSPTPTSTPTPSTTPTATPTVTPTAPPTPSPTPSVTPTPTPTPPPRTGDRVEVKRIDNEVLAKLIFEETTPPAEDDIWLIVAYRKDGELTRLEMPPITDMTAGFVIPEKYKDCEINVYVWNKNMKPLMSVQKVDV